MSQKKIHARGFKEGVEEHRAARVGFKRYLRELEEKMTDVEVFEDDQDLPDDESAIQHLLQSFTDAIIDADMHQDAREMDTPEDGVDFLMDELRKWLQQQGHSSKDVETWMDKNDDEIFDYLFNGLT